MHSTNSRSKRCVIFSIHYVHIYGDCWLIYVSRYMRRQGNRLTRLMIHLANHRMLDRACNWTYNKSQSFRGSVCHPIASKSICFTKSLLNQHPACLCGFVCISPWVGAHTRSPNSLFAEERSRFSSRAAQRHLPLGNGRGHGNRNMMTTTILKPRDWLHDIWFDILPNNH